MNLEPPLVSRIHMPEQTHADDFRSHSFIHSLTHQIQRLSWIEGYAPEIHVLLGPHLETGSLQMCLVRMRSCWGEGGPWTS